jgi:hypothetical protein
MTVIATWLNIQNADVELFSGDRGTVGNEHMLMLRQDSDELLLPFLIRSIGLEPTSGGDAPSSTI